MSFFAADTPAGCFESTCDGLDRRRRRLVREMGLLDGLVVVRRAESETAGLEAAGGPPLDRAAVDEVWNHLVGAGHGWWRAANRWGDDRDLPPGRPVAGPWDRTRPPGELLAVARDHVGRLEVRLRTGPTPAVLRGLLRSARESAVPPVVTRYWPALLGDRSGGALWEVTIERVAATAIALAVAQRPPLLGAVADVADDGLEGTVDLRATGRDRTAR